MRQLLVAGLLTLSFGCQAVRNRLGADACDPCPEAVPCPPPTTPAPVCQPPVQQAPRPPVSAPAPERRREVTETEIRTSAIAQDIMLVPRTVYVPYAAQTPIAPVRLAGVAAGQPSIPRREIVTGPRDCATDRQDVGTDSSVENLRQMSEKMAQLQNKIEQLEKERRERPQTFAQPSCPPVPEPIRTRPAPVSLVPQGPAVPMPGQR